VKKVKILAIVVAVGIFASVVARNIFAQSASASLFFSSTPTSPSAGQTVNIKVYVDTGGNQVNTVSAHMQYPADRLKFVSSSFANSEFTSVVERDEITSGRLKYTAFIIPHFQGSQGLFVELTFQALASGKADIFFLPTSGVYLADGTGRDILSLTVSDNLSIDVSASGTQSDNVLDSQGLQDDSISLEEQQAGVVDYSVSAPIAQKPSADQDTYLTATPAASSQQTILVVILIVTLVLLGLATIFMLKKLIDKRQGSKVNINQEAGDNTQNGQNI